MKHTIWIGFWIFAVAAEIGLAVYFSSWTFGVYGLLALALIAYNVREKEYAGGSFVIPQEGKEAGHDVADKMRKIMERWEKSISPTNRRFGDRFAAGEIHVLIVFRDAQTEKVWFVCLERDSAHNYILSEREDKGVLVSIVHSPEQPECLIPVPVWLQGVDGLLRFPGHTLYASSLSGFVTVFGMKYRELNVFPFFGGAFAKADANLDKLKGKVIEGAPQVVDHVTSDGGDIGGIDIQWPELKAWLSGLCLKFEANHLEGRFSEVQDSRFQIVEVLLGPFNFYADQAQSIVGKHWKLLRSRIALS